MYGGTCLAPQGSAQHSASAPLPGHSGHRAHPTRPHLSATAPTTQQASIPGGSNQNQDARPRPPPDPLSQHQQDGCAGHPPSSRIPCCPGEARGLQPSLTPPALSLGPHVRNQAGTCQSLHPDYLPFLLCLKNVFPDPAPPLLYSPSISGKPPDTDGT